MKCRRPTSVRLDPDVRRLLAKVKNQLHLSQSQAINHGVWMYFTALLREEVKPCESK